MAVTQAELVAEPPTSDAPSAPRGRIRILVDLAGITLVALLLRLSAVSFGLPTMLHPDEPTNLRIGAQMAANGDWNPHFFAYPSLMFDVIALADRADRLITGHMIVPSSLISQNMGTGRTADPGLVLGLRLVTVALSVGICLLAYAVIRRTTGRRWAAVGCGLLAATSPLLVTNGVFITPDTYSAFFTVAVLASALAVVRRGTMTDYVLGGLAVGFAAGSKYDVLAALPIVVGHVLREGRNALRPRALRSLATAAVAAAAGFVLTTPAALFDTGSLASGLSNELHHYSSGHPGAQGGASGFYLSTLLHDQPVLLLGAVVAVVGAYFGRFRNEVIVVGAFAFTYFALIASETVRFDRDALPLLPALILLTGYAAVWVAELVAARRPGIPEPWRLASSAVVVTAVLIPSLIASLGVPHVLDESPRAEAATWLETHIPKGSSVAVDSYGPWLSPASYRLTESPFIVLGRLPSDTNAIVLTEKGSGRFIDDAKSYPQQAAAYTALLTHYCVSVKFTDGPWVEILTPCS